MVAFFGSSYFATPTNASRYIGMGESDTSETKVALPLPTGGTLKGLQVRQSVASGASSRSYTYRVYVNGNTTGVTCPITGATQLTCSSTSSVTVTAGDRVALLVTPSNGQQAPSTAASATWSFVIVP